jgi:hypothetical protein
MSDKIEKISKRIYKNEQDRKEKNEKGKRNTGEKVEEMRREEKGKR